MVFPLLEDRSAATPRASCKPQRRSFLVLGEIHSTAQPGQQQCSSKACRRLLRLVAVYARVMVGLSVLLKNKESRKPQVG